MEQKKLIMLFMALGSTGGSMLPCLWGADIFSLASVFLSAAGGFLGIWIGYKLRQ